MAIVSFLVMIVSLAFFYRWKFLTNDYDIGFGLFLKSDVSRWRGLRVSTVVSSKTALCVVDNAEDCN